jgi:zinc protease
VEDRVALQMVEGIVDILVREELREKRGGIYGAGVRGQVAGVPEGRYQFEINFTADPTRVDELVEAALAQVADLRDNGPSADNFAKVHEQLRRGNEERLKQNGAWLAWLTRSLTTPEGALTDIPAITQAIESVTPEQVQAAAAELLRPDRYVRLVLHPEGFQP